MGIKTADRTFELIELFAMQQVPLTLSLIGEKMAIPLSSAHALIKSLQERGYLYEVSRRDGYYLTKKLGQMAEQIARGVPLLDRINPYLQRLSEEISETVLLAKRQGDAVTYLDVVESRQSIRFSPNVGETKALHCSSSGKAILGSLSDKDLDATLKRLPFDQRTPRTIIDRKTLRAQIVADRERGWYAVIGENISDLMAVASTFNVGGELYVLTAGGPIQRFHPAMAEHANCVRKTCAILQQALN